MSFFLPYDTYLIISNSEHCGGAIANGIITLEIIIIISDFHSVRSIPTLQRGRQRLASDHLTLLCIHI